VTTDNYSRRSFLKLSGIGIVGTTLNFSFNELTLYVGTYTSGKSEGIYIYRMDQTTGQLKAAGSIRSENPSFLTIDPAKRFLYAVNETPTGAVSAFRIDSTTHQLTPLNQQSSHGADPCH
jgi:6-phosphogluconolactonase